jgi:hypothetical protein
MVAYSAASLPLESFISRTDPTMWMGDSGNPYLHAQKMNHIYRISDEGYICNLHLDQNPVSVPRNLTILLDFAEGVQNCVAVKASLIMSEQRLDSTRVQDKLLSSVVRSAVDAETLNLMLHFRSDLCNSFQCPLFKLVYMLDIEFTLEVPGAGTSSSAEASEPPRLSFNIPVQVESERHQQQQLLQQFDMAPLSRLYSHRCLAARYEVL